MVVSLTTWEAHHSPRAKPFVECPRSYLTLLNFNEAVPENGVNVEHDSNKNGKVT